MFGNRLKKNADSVYFAFEDRAGGHKARPDTRRESFALEGVGPTHPPVPPPEEQLERLSTDRPSRDLPACSLAGTL
jgi:hypothetical protein